MRRARWMASAARSIVPASICCCQPASTARVLPTTLRTTSDAPSSGLHAAMQIGRAERERAGQLALEVLQPLAADGTRKANDGGSADFGAGGKLFHWACTAQFGSSRMMAAMRAGRERRCPLPRGWTGTGRRGRYRAERPFRRLRFGGLGAFRRLDDVGHAATELPCASARMQATACPSPNERKAGTSGRAFVDGIGQRVRNTQPEGGSTGLGMSPLQQTLRPWALPGSGFGRGGQQRARVGMQRAACRCSAAAPTSITGRDRARRCGRTGTRRRRGRAR